MDMMLQPMWLAMICYSYQYLLNNRLYLPNSKLHKAICKYDNMIGIAYTFFIICVCKYEYIQ